MNLTLTRLEDTHNFVCGMELVLTRLGEFVPVRWYHRVARRLRLRRLTRWWRPRTIVVAIDYEAGCITTCEQRFSWRHWKWLP